MLMRSYLLILIAILFTGCAHHKQPTVKNPPLPSSTQSKPVTAFSQVDIKGNINVYLQTGYRTPSVVFRGDPRDLAQTNTQVRQNVLYITTRKGTPKYGPVSVVIRTQTLNRINYIGKGSITGNKLRTSQLDVFTVSANTTRLDGAIGLRSLSINGNGLTQIGGISSPDLQIHLKKNPKVQLRGFAGIRHLNVDGGGWLSMYWVKSDNLSITAKRTAKIQLAGAVNRLEVELYGDTQFKGRYLRVNRAFVKTYGHSTAEITAVNHQHCLASDASDIYYYKVPKMRADFMAYNGAVLDMREWSEFD